MICFTGMKSHLTRRIFHTLAKGMLFSFYLIFSGHDLSIWNLKALFQWHTFSNNATSNSATSLYQAFKSMILLESFFFKPSHSIPCTPWACRYIIATKKNAFSSNSKVPVVYHSLNTLWKLMFNVWPESHGNLQL